MNNALRFGLAAAAVAVVVLVGITLLPRTGGVGGSGPGPSAAPTPTQAATPSQAATPTPVVSPSTSAASNGFPAGPLPAGTYTVMPFSATNAQGVCMVPPQTGCTEITEGASLRFTVTVPDGWSGIDAAVWLEENLAPSGAALGFGRGAWLLSDPCKVEDPDIPVGPTVADFVDALANHPILETTTPVDVTLAGYSGKYLDLQFPADVSTEAKYNPACPYYRPWEPGIYAQGPNHRWHLWVLDVDGVRVVVQSMDYPGTPEARRTELQAMVDSLKIEP